MGLGCSIPLADVDDLEYCTPLSDRALCEGAPLPMLTPPPSATASP